MKITSILAPNCVLHDIQAKNKKDVIVEIVGIMKSLKMINDSEKIVEVLLERESLGSTGIGCGVAIPHSKTDEVDTLKAVIGRSSQGVEYDSLDGDPVHLFFVLLTPKDSTGEHLKALARISTLLKDKLFRQELLDAADGQTMYQLLQREDEKWSKE